MTWQDEFGAGYEVPRIVTDTLTDQSWHNDACPSFGTEIVRLWVEHPDPELRESQGARYAVTVWDREGSFYEGADLTYALATYEYARAHAYDDRARCEYCGGQGCKSCGFTGAWFAEDHPDPTPIANAFCLNRSAHGDACGECEGCKLEILRLRADASARGEITYDRVSQEWGRWSNDEFIPTDKEQDQ